MILNIEKMELSGTWVIVRVGEFRYCINTKYISGISELNNLNFKIKTSKNNFIKGRYLVYKAIIPVIDFPRILGCKTTDDKRMEFSNDMHKILYEHEAIVDAIEWSYLTNDNIDIDIESKQLEIVNTLADVRASRYEYEQLVDKIVIALNIINELTDDILGSMGELDKSRDNEVRLAEIKRQTDKVIKKSIHRIIDINNSKYNEVCLVISSKGETFGITVDEVESISDVASTIKNKSGKVTAGSIEIKDREYDILNITKLANIARSEA